MGFNIPKKVHVGYQNRTGTYSGKLGFITYMKPDGSGLKQEGSWNSWRDNSINTDEFDNVPIDGFVLNQNGGGSKSYGHWERAEFVRVYHPTGFEFEISFDNLLFLIQECGIEKGKGIVGKCVFAWKDNGQKVILLPETCKEYTDNIKTDDVEYIPFVKKNGLKEGHQYMFKNGKVVTYLGKHICNNLYTSYQGINVKPQLIFLTSNGKYASLAIGTIFQESAEPVDNYKMLLESMQYDWLFAPITEMVLSNEPLTEYKRPGIYTKLSDSEYLQVTNTNQQNVYRIYYRYTLSDFFKSEYDNSYRNISLDETYKYLYAKNIHGNLLHVESFYYNALITEIRSI